MSLSNNPPQLQLSLGHQTFKRSFTQFGLDVDDAEDSEGGSSATSSSSNSSRSAGGSGNESSGTRSVSSGSSYSSQAGDGVYGYSDGERSERNKRARSEGPEREAVSAASSASPMDNASVLSLPASSGSAHSITDSQGSVAEQGMPEGATTANSATSYQHASSLDATSTFNLPVLDFNPSTPSVAEFVALRASGTYSRTAQDPPGFMNMLSPRSSSPAPPPAVDVDVAMHEGDDEDAVEGQFDSFGPRVGRQYTGVMDSVRSDALLESATRRLRSSMDRAHEFDRMLAPLRSDAADGTAGSSQRFSRPRLPPFDFEASRWPSPPTYRVDNRASASALPNPFDRVPQQSANSGGSTSSGSTTSTGVGASMDGRPSFDLLPSTLLSDLDDEDIESEMEDDILVDRELANLDSDLQEVSHPLSVDSSLSGSERGPLHMGDSDGDGTRYDVSAQAIEDRVRAINSLTDRTIDDLTSFISTSETEDDARLSSFFNSSGLNSRLSIGEDYRGNASRSTRPSTNVSSSLASQETSSRRPDNLTSGVYSLSSPTRPILHSNPSWNRTRDRQENDIDQTETTTGRGRGWPWNDLLSSPSTNQTIPGLGPRSNSETQATQARVNAEEPPRLQFRPQSPFVLSPLLSDSRYGPTSSEDSEMRRIERMVEMDMETNVQSRFISSSRRNNEEISPASRLRSLTSTAQRSSPARPQHRPNLPTLRSAILDRLSDDDPISDLLRFEREGGFNDGSAFAYSGAPSIASPAQRARASRTDQAMAQSSNNLQNSSQERAVHNSRDVPTTRDWRRSVGQVPLVQPFNSGQELPSVQRVANARASRTSESSSDWTALARDHARQQAETRRQSLEGWFPPIYEEDRLLDVERTRLAEMREQNRLSVPSRSSLWNRHERTTQPQRTLDAVRWASTWDNALRSSSTLVESDLANYLRAEAEADSSESVSNAVSSSTEAAAFFAAGPSYDSARQVLGRPSHAALRQRRVRSLNRTRLNSSNPMDEAWEDFQMQMNVEPSDTYGFGRGLHGPTTPTSRPEGGVSSTSDDLLQILLSRHGVQNRDEAERQAHPHLNVSASAARSSHEFEFDDLPPLEDSQVRTWTWQSPSRHGQDTTSTRPSRRSTSQRSTSRPPSLPPLQFDRLPTMTAERGEDAEIRLFGSEESGIQRSVPWRRRVPRVDGFSETPAINATGRSALQRSNEFALHQAMVLRSVQARQAERQERQRVSTATTASSRSQEFQHAVDVIGSDGLSSSVRQQFNSAFERERDQGRSHPARSEGHTRWGEIADDDADARPSAHSPRSWTESLRYRRRSLSALFAPPPENADNAPPNRGRGTGTAGADPSVQSQTSVPQLDWFSMLSSSRARVRHRARLSRADDEPAPRAFFRLGRNRTGLRNIGDFVRDEDFDTSYENLIALSATLGEVKPRATPAHVINALPTGLYKDWQSPGSDTRCPICLDDYKDIDPLLKAEPCKHWCHKECFEQWLHTAQTCPVCRTKIKSSRRTVTPPPAAGPSRRDEHPASSDAFEDSDDEISFFSSSPGRINRTLFEVLSPNDLT